MAHKINTINFHYNSVGTVQLDYQNCNELCDEKTYIGYIIKANNSLANCTQISEPAVYPIHSLINGWTSCDIQGGWAPSITYSYPLNGSTQYYFDGGFKVDDENSETLPCDGTTTVNLTPTYAIQNIELLGNYVCAKPDSFECKPTNIRRSVSMPNYIGRFPFVEGKAGYLYVDAFTSNLVYDFENKSIGTDTTINTRSLYPYNYKLSCDYEISLEKDIYEIDINLISAAYFTYSDNIPNQVNLPVIGVVSDSVASGPWSNCDSISLCNSPGSYRLYTTGFKTADLCRSYPINPANCNNANEQIQTVNAAYNANVQIVDSAFSFSHKWLQSKNCCEHLIPIDNFENYCCDTNYTKITSKLSCSDIISESRSLTITRAPLLANNPGINIFKFSNPVDQIGYEYVLSGYFFNFSASVCVAKHRTEEIEVANGLSMLFGGCNNVPADGNVVITPTFVPRTISSPKVITVEVYYCKKTYKECPNA